jgi:DNA mismatch repair protein MutS
MEVLAQLERPGDGAQPVPRGRRRRREQVTQAPLFALPSPLLEEMAALDVSAMTPIEAINKLFELQEKARASGRESRGR